MLSIAIMFSCGLNIRANILRIAAKRIISCKVSALDTKLISIIVGFIKAALIVGENNAHYENVSVLIQFAKYAS